MYGKGGRVSLKPSYGRLKLTLVSRFVAMQIWYIEKLSLFYFWSNPFETNRTWSPILGLHVLFVSKRSDQKYKSVNFSLHLWFFVTLQVFGLWTSSIGWNLVKWEWWVNGEIHWTNQLTKRKHKIVWWQMNLTDDKQGNINDSCLIGKYDKYSVKNCEIICFCRIEKFAECPPSRIPIVGTSDKSKFSKRDPSFEPK